MPLLWRRYFTVEHLEKILNDKEDAPIENQQKVQESNIHV